MNVIDYIDYFGKNSFDQMRFNELDNLVFSLISYVDLNDIVSKNSFNQKTIKEVTDIFFNNHDKDYIDSQIIAIRDGIKVLEYASKSDRYKNIKLYNYVYIGDENSQFSAITFKINSQLCCVAFEGTDHLISGWEEDCKMAYRFPVEAQIYAKNYLNKHFSLTNNKLIIVGHSKGGNLALVSSMYCNMFVKRKIINIYSNDGQGLRMSQLNSYQYNSIKDRYIHIIPNYSIVGLLLRNDDNYTVVKSNKKGIIAHSGLTWQVSYDHFEKEKLSRFSKVFKEGFSKWLDNYDDEKRKKFVKSVFKVIYDNNITSLTEISLKKELIQGIIKSSKDIDPCVKEMTLELLKIINKTNLEFPLF